MVDKRKVDFEFEAKVIGGGRITIPQEFREIYNIEVGDRVRVKIIEIIKVPKSRKR
ncbi:AbrB/MazE/SpoVT family DNA-binding domain-containing protein [Thermococcus sp. MV5]|uniref:AbrB/MazE/SpoVT family DNA-binding domain-containing protein n=1 Tax=Thermococcus sp. MV5 TaxID=1638272 RepID=UPI0014398176|nr:AbrB/MazE/SpoVT family DNA-binding domain-containing protein [Thermococcus sp. MV5]